MEIQEVVDKVISTLQKEGIHVNIRRARHSDSVYLLFDYGLLHSMRISDHRQKREHSKYLKYKYNINTRTGTKWKTNKIRKRNHKGKMIEHYQLFCHGKDAELMARQVIKMMKESKKKFGEEQYMDFRINAKNNFPKKDPDWYSWKPVLTMKEED
jgi:uncharacterized membrane protein